MKSMTRFVFAAFAALAMLAAGRPARGAVLYVDRQAGGANTGMSWTDAYTNLASALAASGSGTNLWVAAGTYRDGTPFQMKGGVDLYGGFTNGMAALEERDWTAHPAVLDGQGANTVVYGANSAALDGFIITNGAAINGGGMYNNAVAPAVRNCVFVNNAAGSGGAMYNNGEAADVTVSNCAFLANTAGSGGGIYSYLGDSAVRKSRFVGNQASAYGGALFSQQSGTDLLLDGCTFVSNRAASIGGVIHSQNGNALTVSNCVFEANRADLNAGAIYANNNTLTLRATRFIGNQAANAGAFWNDSSCRGFIEDCAFIGNRATNGVGGAYYGNVGNGSLTNRNCTFAGNTAASATPGELSGGGGALSCSGDNSIYESCVFSANRAAGAGGVVGKGGWDYSPAWTFRRCTFAGNESGVAGGVFYGIGAGEPRFENSVLAGNVSAAGGGAVSLRFESASGIRALHCTFSGNRATTSGGAWLTGSTYAYATNCIFWGNSAGTSGNEIHQQTANRAIIGYSDVQGGWAGLGTNNLNVDPAFRGGTSGTWTAVAGYDPAAGQTALSDSNAVWAANGHAGMTVNPDTNQWLQFVVASNTVDTLYVWGDARTSRAGAAVADAGDGYRIQFFLPQPTSPVMNRGIEAGVTNDIAGAVRPRDEAPEMGAYEVQEDVLAPPDITGLLAEPLHLRVEFSWSNPPSLDLSGVLVVRREGAAPTGTPETGRSYTNGEALGDGQVVHTETAGSWTDTPLNGGTTYHYVFYTFDDIPNYSAGVATDATPVDDTAPPAAIADLVAAGGTGVVSLAWTNPSDTDFGGVLIVRRQGADPTANPETGVKYTVGQMLGDGEIFCYGPAADGAPGAANSFTNAGLPDSTAYHYRVFAFDHSRNYADGALAGATTATDVVPPGDVTGLSLASDDSWIELAWTNPPDADFTGVLILKKAGSAPTGAPVDTNTYAVGDTVDDGLVVYNGGGTRWRDTAVTNGAAYFYRVFTRDEVPNYSDGAGGSATPAVRNVLYVDWQATNANNGASWADAYTNLATALAAAGRGTNLWVAQGTYKPGTIRDATFTLRPDVGVYGGFTNGMTAFRQRDWTANATTLSGDLDGDGVLNVGNAYHVVTATGATNAVLDGFTVTMGYAYSPISDTSPYRDGGGLLLYMSDATLAIRNCSFATNAANYRGGAVFIHHNTRAGSGDAVSNCTFRGNYAFRASDSHGGAVYHVYRPLTIEDSTFEDNSAWSGGALKAYVDDPTVRRSTFARNTAGQSGAAINHDRNDLANVIPVDISGCRFYANRSATYGGAVDFRRAGYTNDVIRNCDFFANETTTGSAGALFLLVFNSPVEGCRFSGNTAAAAAGSYAGALYLYDSDATVRNAVFAGNSAPGGYGGGVWTDNGSRPRFENALVAGNQARYSGGGVCLYDPSRGTGTFVNCTIAGNRTTEPNVGYGGGGLFLRNGIFNITNTILYGNLTAGTGAQARVEIAGDVVSFGYDNVQGGLTGVYAVAGAVKNDTGGVIAADPRFFASVTGTWSAAASYTNASGLTVLTDAAATWTPGRLAGLLLNPNTATGMLAYVVATNTRTTVTVMGVATGGTAGAAYRFNDYRLQNASPCIDTGAAIGAPAGDLLGISRPQGAGVDMGAYERTRASASIEPVTGLTATGGMDQVTLSWTNPTNAGFSGVLVLRRVGAAPTGVPVATNEYVAGDTIGDGVVVYAGWGTDGTPGQVSSCVDPVAPAEQACHYVVFAYDGVPNYADGVAASATTLVDAVKPGSVTGLTAVRGDGTVTLAWTNPPDADFEGVLVVRRLGSAPTEIPVDTNRYAAGDMIGDGRVMYAGPGNSPALGGASGWTDSAAVNGLDHHYAVFAYDEVPNYSAGAGALASPDMARVAFVDVQATGLDNGQSWRHAYTNLATALRLSGTNFSFWVAEGTYYPGASRTNSFTLVRDQSLYGGLTNGMGTLEGRDFDAHAAVLSGDIDGNGVPDTNNSYHVVNATAGTNALLDGLTITMGFAWSPANDTPPFRDGGGVLVYDSDATPRIFNCRFITNAANYRGGAVFLSHATRGAGGAVISNCVFRGNYTFRSGDMGGAIYHSKRQLTVERSTFSGNAAYYGGALYSEYGDPMLRSCTFARNAASHSGGALYHVRNDAVAYTNSLVSACAFYGNTARYYGGAAWWKRANQASDLIENCDFYANQATEYEAAALYLYGYDGVIDGCRFSGNVATRGATGGGIYAGDCDALIRNTVIAGNSAASGSGGGLYTDTGSWPVFENVLVAGNQARYNGGGLCLYDASDRTNRLLNCTVAGNRTTEAGAGYGGGGLFLRNGNFSITNTIIYNNRAAGTGAQVRVELAGDVVSFGHDNVQGGVTGIYAVAGVTNSDNGGNLAADPLFMPAETGHWTADGAYTNLSGLSVFTDAGATWAAGSLAGKLLNPNTNAGALAYCIVSNTPTAITVMGLTSNVLAGAAYEIRDYRLRSFSPCVDSGAADGAPARDLAGVSRPQGGGVDMGAYETVHDAAAPADVTALTATGGLDSVTLQWRNPADPDFDGVLVVRRQGAAPGALPVNTNLYRAGDVLGAGTVVYVGRGSSGSPDEFSQWTDAPLLAQTPYFYEVFAYDGVPNYAAGAGTSATTAVDPVAPGPVSGLAGLGGDMSAILSWTNPPDADFAEVLILRRTGALPTGVPVSSNRYAAGAVIGDGVVVYAGAGRSAVPGAGNIWTNTGLDPSQAYYYMVFAADEVPNYAAGRSVRVGTRTANLLFVDAAATGERDGSSWTDAFSDLKAALARAVPGEAIWVARGTYTPGPFQLATNVAVYGGFTSGMGSLASRDWTANPAILRGGGPVVNGAPGARLDGFTVTGGNGVNGGGIAMSGGSLAVANCNVVSNSAAWGGGLYFSGVQLTLERSRITANYAQNGGGGLYAQLNNVVSSGVIRNCVFIGNRCEGAADGKSDGGAIDMIECPYRIENCTLYNNYAQRRGGGIKIYRGTVENYVIKNCILWNNSTGQNDPDPLSNNGGWEVCIQQDSGTIPLYLVMSYTDWSPVGKDQFYAYYRDGVEKHVFTELMELDPQFEDAAAGDVHLQSTSPCIDAGDPASPFALEPLPNGGRVDMGAYGNSGESTPSGPPEPETGLLFYLR